VQNFVSPQTFSGPTAELGRMALKTITVRNFLKDS